jgi:hypothetical protein
MSIIPISPEVRLTHKCEDGSEVYFRYLTGEHRAKYQDIQESLALKARPYFSEAKKIAVKQISELKKSVEKQGKTDVIIPQLEQLTARIALQKAEEAGDITQADQDKQTAAYVDLFVTGWKIKGAPQKKEDIPASHYFTPVSLTEIMEILSQHIQELMGLSVQDQKN